VKNAIKIVTIGDGSSYTPELMEGFIKRYDEMPISEIWLVDIEEGKEAYIFTLKNSKRMKAQVTKYTKKYKKYKKIVDNDCK